jgi:hypothetical protein
LKFSTLCNIEVFNSHLNRTKEEAEGTAACRRHRRARFDGFDTQEGIPGLVGGK